MRLVSRVLLGQPVLKGRSWREWKFWMKPKRRAGFTEGKYHAEGLGCIHSIGLWISFSVIWIASVCRVRLGLKVAANRRKGADRESKLRKSPGSISTWTRLRSRAWRGQERVRSDAMVSLCCEQRPHRSAEQYGSFV